MTTRTMNLPELTETGSGKYLTINEALHIIDFSMGGIIDRIKVAPGTATEGNAYIAAPTGTMSGGWSAFSNDDIIYYFNGGWNNITPDANSHYFLYDQDIEQFIFWDGTNWIVTNVNPEIVEVAGTTYTLLDSDMGKTVVFTSGSAITLTLPQQSTLVTQAGQEVNIIGQGGGTITYGIEGAETLESLGGATTIVGAHSRATVVRRTTTVWGVYGDVT